MKFNIEYEIPPLRAIYRKEFFADDEKEAKEIFAKEHPKGRIRKMEGSPVLNS